MAFPEFVNGMQIYSSNLNLLKWNSNRIKYLKKYYYFFIFLERES